MPPMMRARKIIPYSKATLSIMSHPSMGRLVRKRGNKAQWMAQASEVPIPRASQFMFLIRDFILRQTANITLQPRCKCFGREELTQLAVFCGRLIKHRLPPTTN